MLDKIAKLDAAVIRGVLVTAVPVLAMLLNIIFGIDEKLFSEKAGEFIEALMTLFTAIGLAYIAWARITKPTPPISDTAIIATEQMLKAGKLSVSQSTPEVKT
jgi:hypothetical protein